MSADIVEVTIGGRRFSGWEGLRISRAFDTCSDAFSMTAPFDPALPEIVAAFRPFGYQAAVVTIDGETVLTGQVEKVSGVTEAEDRAITVEGRSKAGTLIDCNVDAVGFQYAGMSLLSIAKKLAQAYGVEVVSSVGNGPAFKTALGALTVADAESALSDARCQPGAKVFDFLSRIAQDAGLLLTSDAKGRLVLTRIVPTSAPVATLVEGKGGVVRVSGSFDGTKRFSSYRVLVQQDGEPGSGYAAYDNGVKVNRPRVEVGVDTNAASMSTAASWRRAIALGESVEVTVVVTGWRTPGGELWCPGQVVTLKAPGAFILAEQSFVVAGVEMVLDADNGRTTELRLGLPSTWSGEMPGGYPWD